MKLAYPRGAHRAATAVIAAASSAVVLLSSCAQWQPLANGKTNEAQIASVAQEKKEGDKTSAAKLDVKSDSKADAKSETKLDAKSEAKREGDTKGGTPAKSAPGAVAQTPDPSAARPAGPVPTAPGSAPPSLPTPPARPFADVVKDAKEQKGLFTLWSKDEKVWIELKPEQLDQLYMLQVNMSRGVMSDLAPARANWRGYLVTFKKFGNNVQLIAKNYSHYAKPGSPIALATADGTSDSLLAAVPVASQPHPERKSFLIEANPIFMADIPMFGFIVDMVFRAGYALDRGNSQFREISSSDDLTTFDVNAHFATARIPVPSFSMTPSPMPPARPVTGVPDARSFFVGLYYSLRTLPSEPMRPRAADQRVGHFNRLQWDFSDNQAAFARKYVINRWRLEKQDPTATLSEPKKPIVFWLDKNIPHEYRDTVRAGVLEWNKAFEKIGFKDAVRAEQQPDDATWSTHDATRASVRWFVDYNDGALAVGPSITDPRTGEILDADITIGNGWVTLPRRQSREQAWRPPVAMSSQSASVASALDQALARAIGSDAASLDDARASIAKSFVSAQELGALAAATQSSMSRLPRDVRVNAGEWATGSLGAQGAFGHIDEACSYAESALGEASFALDLMALRASESGKPLDPNETERTVHAVLKDVVMHEVGHTLGLRHNFRASTIYTQAQINDATFSRERGISGSVMDYNAFNVALNNEKQGEFTMSTLGPYDYWAVEYAYKELPEASERAELAKIAERSTERELAYATDMELFGDLDGMDPEVNQRDVGGDPLEFAKRRVQLSRELFDRLQSRELARGESYDLLTRNVVSGVGQMARAFTMASKYVGGVVYVRDQAGTNRAPYTPVPADKQRAALKLVVDNLFSQTGFNFKPEFVSRLADDALDNPGPPFDRSLENTLWILQVVTLDRLMSSRVAERIVSTKAKVGAAQNVLTLDELYRTLSDAIWNDLKTDVVPARRALQREHARRLASAITRPVFVTTAAGDARALHRSNAKQLLARINQTLAGGRVTAMTRAHLEETADVLDSALKAQVTRSAG